MAAQVREGHGAGVVAAHPDLPVLRLVQAQQVGDEGRFPAAGGAEDPQVLTGGDVQVQPLEQGAAVAVGRADRAELHGAVHVLHRHRVRRVGDLDLLVQQIRDPLPGGGGAGDAAGVLGHVAQRLHRDLEVGQEQHHVAGAHRAAQHLQAAHHEHRALGDAHEHIGGAFEGGGELLGLHPGLHRLLVAAGELVGDGLLEAVGLHHADRAERLGGGAHEGALALAGAARGAHDLRGGAAGEQQVGQARGDHDAGEERVQQHHHHHEHGEGDEVADQRQPGGDGDVLEPAHVAHEALGGVPDRGAGVVAQREGLEVVEHAGAQLGGDAGADLREGDGGEVVRPGAAGDDDGQA